jgi:hypothetical protein
MTVLRKHHTTVHIDTNMKDFKWSCFLNFETYLKKKEATCITLRLVIRLAVNIKLQQLIF